METLRPLWKDFSYFAHQETGIRWMLEKEINGTDVDGTLVRGGFQCDDMGLGKTIQIAATILNHPLTSTLLLAPLAMVETWAEVCRRAGMAVYEVRAKQWERTNTNGSIPLYFRHLRPCVYVCNYEKLIHNPSLFLKVWDRIVLDEAHKIRTTEGAMAKAARAIVAPIRWAVTGTPLVNSFKDVASLLAFIGVPFKGGQIRWKKSFFLMMPELVIHRSLNSLRSVIKSAPPIPEVHHLKLPFSSEEEEDFYVGIQGTKARYAADAEQLEKLKLLLRLRQLSVHPQVYINAKRRENPNYNRPNWTTPSTKLEAIRGILDEEGVHRTIIFCQFNDEMSLIREYLMRRRIVTSKNILLYHGGLNQTERTEVLKRSKETTERAVMLLQLQAGGVGLNLQEYDRIIFVSPWWTSALMDQAIARAVRMGQTEVVKIYHLHLEAEADEKTINIDTLINSKADQKRLMLEKLFAYC